MKCKILVCYHKPSIIVANECLQPILVGASNAKEENVSELENLCRQAGVSLWRDDSGEHISWLNPHFCELTAMYWAWKNLDCDYYGLFHYRRIFDFKDSFALEMPRKESINHKTNIMDKYHLDSQNIIEACRGCDILLPKKVIDHGQRKRAEKLSLYELYDTVHHIEDLNVCLEYIALKYPQMYATALQTIHHKPLYWHIANMCIMKKQLYFEYCQWVFDILFGVQDRIPYCSYDSYQARVFGFLSERLLNIWIEHKKQTQSSLVIKELPLVLFRLKSKKKWLGWVQDGNVRRFFVCKIRILKKRL